MGGGKTKKEETVYIMSWIGYRESNFLHHYCSLFFFTKRALRGRAFVFTLGQIQCRDTVLGMISPSLTFSGGNLAQLVLSRIASRF